MVEGHLVVEQVDGDRIWGEFQQLLLFSFGQERILLKHQQWLI